MTHEVAEVLATVPHRTWEGDNGALHYFMVKLTDGQVAEAGKKKPDTPPKVGDRYKELRQPSANAPADAVPMLKGPITDYQGGGGGKDFKADPAKLRSKNASSALHAAVSLADTYRDSKKFTSDEIVVVAGKFYDFIESKARVGDE